MDTNLSVHIRNQTLAGSWKEYAMLTTLELISSILTVLLAIAEPDAGDAVPTGARKVALVTPGPMGYWNIPTQNLELVMRVSHKDWFALPYGMFSGCSGHYLSLGRCLIAKT